MAYSSNSNSYDSNILSLVLSQSRKAIMKIPTLALALSQLLNFDSFLDDSPNPPFYDLSQASQRLAPTPLPSPNSSSLVLGRVVIG
jgi:hypothetical protein